MNRTWKSIGIAIALTMGVGLGAGELRPLTQDKHTPDVVYVGTPYDVVSAMLKLARVKKDDVVYDLGCGDGRMIVLAAKKYGCQVVQNQSRGNAAEIGKGPNMAVQPGRNILGED